jgi:hypothetical protein
MPTDTDLLETFAPLREVGPTPEEIARVLAAADELRAPRSLARPRGSPARAVALVAATATLIGALAALPGGDSDRPQDAHASSRPRPRPRWPPSSPRRPRIATPARSTASSTA